MPLTDPACRNAKCPPEKARARFADSQGLYLEVLPSGGKYWRLKYRYAGKEKRLAPRHGVGAFQRVLGAGEGDAEGSNLLGVHPFADRSQEAFR